MKTWLMRAINTNKVKLYRNFEWLKPNINNYYIRPALYTHAYATQPPR